MTHDQNQSHSQVESNVVSSSQSSPLFGWATSVGCWPVSLLKPLYPYTPLPKEEEKNCIRNDLPFLRKNFYLSIFMWYMSQPVVPILIADPLL